MRVTLGRIGSAWAWTRRVIREHGVVAYVAIGPKRLGRVLNAPAGAYLTPMQVLRISPTLVRRVGLRRTVGAYCRAIGFTYGPKPSQPAAIANVDAPGRDLLREDGVVEAVRPANGEDCALEIPFRYPPPVALDTVGAIIHCYYPDVLGVLLDRLGNIPCGVDLFISTDTQEKRGRIEALTRNWERGSVDVRVVPNRGRDIAPMLIAFRDVFERHDIILHLHTKKSPHGGEALSVWLDHLLTALLGSRAIVESNLSLFDDPRLGIVFPQHLFDLRGVLNWGYNYDLARGLARRMGFGIDTAMTLEFPSGSMFWARTAALRPLLDLDLAYDVFPEEAGQVDGTLAHAIERLFLMVAESRGYEWLKVAVREGYPEPLAVIPIDGPHHLVEARLKVFHPILAGGAPLSLLAARPYSEARPFRSYPSRNRRPRVTLLVPTVNPSQTFGGVATALRLFEEVLAALGPDVDGRIVTTDAPVDAEGLASMRAYASVPLIQSRDEAPLTLVDAFERGEGRLDLRAGELVIATAWWTALHARALEADRTRYFGGTRPFVYIIQDNEPYFYGWGSKFALAAASYEPADNVVALINSAELYEVMTRTYRFRHAFCIPYALNEVIASALTQNRPREPLILVYGRPSVERNAYGLIAEGLALWQRRDPIRASRWTIAFMGEGFDPAYVEGVSQARIVGKASLEGYADYLSRASVGISLMLSPHPSYPPLEMAHAGLTTITNPYDGKDLSSRHDGIRSLWPLTPEALADAIEAAVAQRDPLIGQAAPFIPVTAADDAPAPLDIGRLAGFIRNELFPPIA